ncbi:FMN-binding protein [Paenibacillus cremeus]|uniref:FMN-binding protein n=1 Tax=Paenibacillus cremeus TaxID=2163881 RepID=A0A559K6V7_9BACL|nr:FMN-binding protein [Paenibacillus cremeus]TVY07875.1 FMN-binding protein [Paenibacillus cremeus]
MAKMSKPWIVLCSTAISAIYAAGYFATESQAMQLPPQAVQTSSPQSSISQTTKAKAVYKDGTYTGSGRNRRGSIGVTVTIKQDKITDVEISNFAMHYSERDVVGLPNEVLQKQSARVDNVSGATYSTQAFEDAVQDALSKAKI